MIKVTFLRDDDKIIDKITYENKQCEEYDNTPLFRVPQSYHDELPQTIYLDVEVYDECGCCSSSYEEKVNNILFNMDDVVTSLMKTTKKYDPMSDYQYSVKEYKYNNETNCYKEESEYTIKIDEIIHDNTKFIYHWLYCSDETGHKIVQFPGESTEHLCEKQKQYEQSKIKYDLIKEEILRNANKEYEKIDRDSLYRTLNNHLDAANYKKVIDLINDIQLKPHYKYFTRELDYQLTKFYNKIEKVI